MTATDPFGAPATSDVTITVTNVNEAPIAKRWSYLNRSRAEGGTDLDDRLMEDEFTVSDVDAVDPVADLKWSLSGADASKFELTGSDGDTYSRLQG